MDKEWSKKREESYQVQEKRAMEYFSRSFLMGLRKKRMPPPCWKT